MFTGIVQSCEQVVSRQGMRLQVGLPAGVADWQMGESIAVNGVCLTLVGWDGALQFDISEETDNRTTLGELASGQRVNIERAMRASDRFGGHIVQGHVDQVGRVVSIQPLDGSTVFTFDAGGGAGRYLIDKGSVSINGISLTVVEPKGETFQVAAIPHTLAETNLGDLKPGDAVNIEFDVLTKHVVKLLAARI